MGPLFVGKPNIPLTLLSLMIRANCQLANKLIQIRFGPARTQSSIETRRAASASAEEPPASQVHGSHPAQTRSRNRPYQCDPHALLELCHGSKSCTASEHPNPTKIKPKMGGALIQNGIPLVLTHSHFSSHLGPGLALKDIQTETSM